MPSKELYRQMLEEYHRLMEMDAGTVNAFLSAIAVGLVGSKATQVVSPPELVRPVTADKVKNPQQLSFPFHDNP